jgi:hypothetical protein
VQPFKLLAQRHGKVEVHASPRFAKVLSMNQ